jgi:DNA-directed RNA polymerase specialized sigma24 family protein
LTIEGIGSLCEQPAVREQLLAVVLRLNGHSVYWDLENLLQEGLLRIWHMQQIRPRQTLSWYLQNVEFHLRNFLKAGRSLDSAERGGQRVELPTESGLGGRENQRDDWDSISQIYADDLGEELKRRWNCLDAAVFQFLLKGLGTREIARRLKVSVGTVGNCRYTIATLARGLLGKLGACE